MHPGPRWQLRLELEGQAWPAGEQALTQPSATGSTQPEADFLLVTQCRCRDTGSACSQGAQRWDQGLSGGQQNAAQNFPPVSCLTCRENTLYPHEGKAEGRRLFPWGTERVFSALVQSSRPDPLWISDDLLAVRGEQLLAWVREGRQDPRSPGRCEGVKYLRTPLPQVQYRTRQ